ncbi:hypothetical protein GCM10017783_01880 [Deinococcus piscis]|uniref:Oxalate:formate antiporter n=1 Tax=Deinococcus piscis TaxID=394230 RepID=A0ABQ3K011_9DEIO|nr:hypothetical protein [Deinococcus piscis]GHF93472.1 hypothetical protein GCM10017783_01880 [Deinococcus piscis]
MTRPSEPTANVSPLLIGLAWLVVLIPLGWGVWETLVKVGQLF